MSWTKLAPIVKSTGRPMASASIQVNKDGVPKVALILSASLKDEYGAWKRADISAGEGEHEGWLLVEFGDEGAFEAKNFVHGGARIFTPIGPGVPEKPAGSHPCQVRDKTKSSFVVVLPVIAWRKEIEERLAPKRSAAAPVGAPAAAVPPPAGNGQLLDAVEYLRGKGHAVERLAGGRFQVDGEALQLGQVLKRINDYRAKADLDPLPAGKIR